MEEACQSTNPLYAIAYELILHMEKAIVLVDKNNRVIFYNEALGVLLPGLKIDINGHISGLVEYLLNRITGYSTVANTIRKIDFKCEFKEPIEEEVLVNLINKTKHYRITIKSIFINGNIFAGNLIMISDITKVRALMDEIQHKNIELSTLNRMLEKTNNQLTKAVKRLEDHSKTIEELAITRERNRMAGEIHDIIGHTITLLVALLENSKNCIINKEQNVLEKIDQCINLSRQCLGNIRGSLKEFFSKPIDKINFESLIKELINGFEQSGLSVDYFYYGDPRALDSYTSMLLYQICREAMTNSMRHGKARNITLTIKHFADLIRVYIFDNGCGCDKIVKGFGLSKMEQKVQERGGSIYFGSDGESGFNVIVKLPLKKIIDKGENK